MRPKSSTAIQKNKKSQEDVVQASESSSFIDLVKGRRSIRRFQRKSVEREQLQKCVEAARFAPSAENAEPWRFLIIDDPQILKEVANRAFTGIYAATRWAARAPVLVVVLVELNLLTHRIGKQVTGIHYYLIDVGIAGEHFILQAQELGLGTCWIGWFNARGVRKALNIPPRFKPIELIAVGYPDPSKLKEKRRKQLQDICWFNKIR